MPPVGFEPTISAGKRPQTYALDGAVTEIGIFSNNNASTRTMIYLLVLLFKHGKETFVFCTWIYLLEDRARKIWAPLERYIA
jgi:hypothetical protein